MVGGRIDTLKGAARYLSWNFIQVGLACTLSFASYQIGSVLHNSGHESWVPPFVMSLIVLFLYAGLQMFAIIFKAVWAEIDILLLNAVFDIQLPPRTRKIAAEIRHEE